MPAPRQPVLWQGGVPTVDRFTAPDGVVVIDNLTGILYVLKVDGSYVQASGTVADGSITNAKLAPNAVTTDKILDGTILNADINGAAAIAEAKLTLASDAAAGTASRRSLGTGATQAAAGDHTHAASGGLLAFNQHNPGTLADYSIASTTFTDLDATNMAVTFTAPASGIVVLHLAAYCNVVGAVTLIWGLRESTTNLTPQVHMTNSAAAGRLTAQIRITGLTPSSVHTYKWSQASFGGTAHTYAGGPVDQNGAGPAIMEVWSG